MKFTYDSAGNVTGTTISGISYDKILISSTSYTNNGNAISSSTDASGITKSYLYNDRGLLIGETDANGVTMRYDYHAGNDRQTVAYISGLVSAYDGGRRTKPPPFRSARRVWKGSVIT